MNLVEWNARYLNRERSTDFDPQPTPLLVETAADLNPGSALDLACGTGRNALWLARRGWSVTAIDGAPAAIEALEHRAKQDALSLNACVADLTASPLPDVEAGFDLVLMSYFLQRDLFPRVKAATNVRGIVIAIVHTVEDGEPPTLTRALPGELASFFNSDPSWQVLHSYEGPSRDPAHYRAVSEIVARNKGQH